METNKAAEIVQFGVQAQTGTESRLGKMIRCGSNRLNTACLGTAMLIGLSFEDAFWSAECGATGNPQNGGGHQGTNIIIDNKVQYNALPQERVPAFTGID